MRPLIAANWKMHGRTSWAEKPIAFNGILPTDQRREIDILICPPFPFITALSEKAANVQILTGAQDCHAEAKGAHTGDISAEMLADAGAAFVIVGHSERRAQGEGDADVKQKAKAALRAGLTPIICCGESLAQREAGEALSVVQAQLENCCPDADDIVIAYEPIWAIGTGKVPSLEDIAQMHAHIRHITGENIRILYGGSVKPANAGDILSTQNVDGALIGGASLKMDSLAKIAKSAL